MPKDNLLNSACLDLFEFIKRENIKPLVKHLGNEYKAKFQQITYVDTFHQLLARYEQLLYAEAHPHAVSEAEQSFTSAETVEAPNMVRGTVNGGRWQMLKEQDAEEEAYFNGPDEDDENLPSATKLPTNGASPLRPLVNYPDDEDELDAAPEVVTTERPRGNAEATPKSQTPGPQSPPERLAEKRRREEDEEDELGKLSTTPKRRSSGGSNVSNASDKSTAATNTKVLRRTKSINSGKDGPPKIAISLGGKNATNHSDTE